MATITFQNGKRLQYCSLALLEEIKNTLRDAGVSWVTYYDKYGDHHTCLFNVSRDGYVEVCGTKHPIPMDEEYIYDPMGNYDVEVYQRAGDVVKDERCDEWQGWAI